jgi:hypothetical protein
VLPLPVPLDLSSARRIIDFFLAAAGNPIARWQQIS